jgi:hypothetical protein
MPANFPVGDTTRSAQLPRKISSTGNRSTEREAGTNPGFRIGVVAESSKANSPAREEPVAVVAAASDSCVSSLLLRRSFSCTRVAIVE